VHPTRPRRAHRPTRQRSRHAHTRADRAQPHHILSGLVTLREHHRCRFERRHNHDMDNHHTQTHTHTAANTPPTSRTNPSMETPKAPRYILVDMSSVPVPDSCLPVSLCLVTPGVGFFLIPSWRLSLPGIRCCCVCGVCGVCGVFCGCSTFLPSRFEVHVSLVDSPGF
jgi:hypothetical protein